MTDDTKALFIPDYFTRETNALLKATDVARVALCHGYRRWRAPLPEVRMTADDRNADIGRRLELRRELARIMGGLSGYSWELEKTVQRRKDAVASQDDREFWLDAWEFLHKHAPDAPLFEMFSRDDLLDELNREEEPT